MLSRKGKTIAYIAGVLMLCGLGAWQISTGKTAPGSAIIAAVVAATMVRIIKNRRIREMENKGLNPYDERTLYIAGRAARMALSVWVVICALYVLLGTALGPQILVNPYNMAAYAMGIPLLIYSGAYYYYNARS